MHTTINMRSGRRWASGEWSLVLVCLVLLSSGCVRTAAKTTPDAPLDMPAPPPRDFEPASAEAPAPVPLATEPARSTPTRATRPAPREQPARPEPPKVEPPKPEPPPAEPPKPVDEPPRPASLQTTPATGDGEMERGIRTSLARANADLNRIDYRVLNADARTQYDTAKRFIRQADDALKTKNLVFAKNLADKAAALAAQLGGR
jgi:hypothetical protein